MAMASGMCFIYTIFFQTTQTCTEIYRKQQKTAKSDQNITNSNAEIELEYRKEPFTLPQDSAKRLTAIAFLVAAK